jgi:hypothetical protein
MPLRVGAVWVVEFLIDQHTCFGMVGIVNGTRRLRKLRLTNAALVVNNLKPGDIAVPIKSKATIRKVESIRLLHLLSKSNECA